MAKALKTKEERIELRVKSQDKRLLEKAAQAQGLSLSSYLVTKSLHAAHEDAAIYKTHTPVHKDLNLFQGLLEDPPASNEKLKAAARRYHDEVYLSAVKLARDLMKAWEDAPVYQVPPGHSGAEGKRVVMDKTAVKKIRLGEESPQNDLAYWKSRPAEERLSAVETLRREYYGNSARLQRIARVIKSAQS